MTLTATFAKNQLLYFDANNRLQIGAWGVQVNTTNIAYFKFASVVGFTMTGSSDSWGSGDIKFNPTTTANSTWEASSTGYSAIPGWNSTNTTVTKPSTYSITSNLDYVSTTVHNITNVKNGYGDPCQLIGYTGAEINAMSSLPTSSFRLPTTRENDTFVGYTGTPTTGSVGTPTMSGSDPQIGTFTSGNALPAAYRRNTDGSVGSNWGLYGYYWSATPYSSSLGYYLTFYSGNVTPSNNDTAQYGQAVRCVPQ